MEVRAKQTEEQLKIEAIDHRETKRKEKIKHLIMSKRLTTHKKDQVQQMDQMDQEEELEMKGRLNLCQYHKKSKRRSRQRWWNWKSTGHHRDYFPYIHCYHCQRLGHAKANCFMYRIDKLLKALEKQQKKKEKKMRQKNQKQKKREEELEIPKNRAKQSTFINTEGKWRLK